MANITLLYEVKELTRLDSWGCEIICLRVILVNCQSLGLQFKTQMPIANTDQETDTNVSVSISLTVKKKHLGFYSF